jgi:hypothetical protein
MAWAMPAEVVRLNHIPANSRGAKTMIVNQRRDAKFRSVSLSWRGVEALDAGLEVVSSPVALWLRLGVALVLGVVFSGPGLLILIGFVDTVLTGSDRPDGNGFAAVSIGLVATAIGVGCFAAGIATYRTYSRRGLI